MKHKERNQTHKWLSSRTRRRGAESPIRDLPEAVWEVQQRPSEGALISFTTPSASVRLCGGGISSVAMWQEILRHSLRELRSFLWMTGVVDTTKMSPAAPMPVIGYDIDEKKFEP